MDVELSSEQELLRDTAAKFIQSECPMTVVRELIEGGVETPKDYLTETAELGWYAMLVPEVYGGGTLSGEGLRDLAIIAEERGRGIQPGSFVTMNVVAAGLARAGSASRQSAVLPGLAAGEFVATWVPGSPDATWDPGATIAATPVGDGWQLDGRSCPVSGATSARWLLVTCRTSTGPGVSQFLVRSDAKGIHIDDVESHDITQRFASVSFDRVRVDADALFGAAGHSTADVEAQLQIAIVLSVAETIGAADALFELTRQYALDRTAFGRPIGSFQAIKHQLADMSLSLECAKAVATAATRAVQVGGRDAAEIASMAKVWSDRVGIEIAQGCFQIFAGIGFTWEHDLHLYLRRITMNSVLFGQAEWHLERICQLHALGQSVA